MSKLGETNYPLRTPGSWDTEAMVLIACDQFVPRVCPSFFGNS